MTFLHMVVECSINTAVFHVNILLIIIILRRLRRHLDQPVPQTPS